MKSLWLLLLAAQLPTHLIASPLPIAGELCSVDKICIESQNLIPISQKWPAVDWATELIEPFVKRGFLPFIPKGPKTDTSPVTGPKSPIDPVTDPLFGPGTGPVTDIQPIIFKTKDPAAPKPTSVPEPKLTSAPEPQPTSAPEPQPTEAPKSVAAAPPPDPTPVNGNDPTFNGYDVAEPNKGVTTLENNIRDNTPDVSAHKFDEPVNDPVSPGNTITKYQKPDFIPNPLTTRTGYGTYDKLTLDASRLQDPEINLPVSSTMPDGSLNPAGMWKEVKIRSEKGTADVIDLGSNKDGSAIALRTMSAEEDGNPASAITGQEILKRLPVSELAFQGAALARDSSLPASNLRVIMHQGVINSGTQNTLRTAYQRNGIPPDQKAVFRSDAPKDSPEGQAFDALMKTKSLEVSNFLLADHHQSFGNKVVQKIISFPTVSNEFDLFLMVG